MTAPHDRIQLLAGRVRWLDRYRHVIAIVAGLIALRFGIVELSEALDAQWSDFAVTLFAGMLAIGAWWGAEVVLAYVTALWETEYDRLARAHDIPRAVLRRRRRK